MPELIDALVGLFSKIINFPEAVRQGILQQIRNQFDRAAEDKFLSAEPSAPPARVVNGQDGNKQPGGAFPPPIPGDSLEISPAQYSIDPVFLRAALIKALPLSKASAAKILMAQAAFESGYRGKLPWKVWNFNFSGIKSSTKNPHVYLRTTEYMSVENANKLLAADPAHVKRLGIVDNNSSRVGLQILPKHPLSRFRAYPTLEDWARNHVQLLLQLRYAGCLEAACEGDSDKFVAIIAKGGYFTAPPAQYQAGIRERLKLFS